MTEIMQFRGIERLLAVIIGGLAIWLGYRLFQTVELPGDGAFEAKIDGYGSLLMSRIGPGVFFALFGAYVVVTSLRNPVSLNEAVSTPASVPSGGVAGEIVVNRSYSGALPGTDADAREARLAEARQTLSRLAGVPPQLEGGRRTDAEDALRKARLALVGEVWDPAWGEYATFRDEALRGDLGTLPKNYAPAVTLLRHGATP